MRLPRAFMQLPQPHESRVFRALVLTEYLPLEQINSLNDFTIVYTQTFEGTLRPQYCYSLRGAHIIEQHTTGCMK